MVAAHAMVFVSHKTEVYRDEMVAVNKLSHLLSLHNISPHFLVCYVSATFALYYLNVSTLHSFTLTKCKVLWTEPKFTICEEQVYSQDSNGYCDS